jgi:hypothetical protein
MNLLDWLRSGDPALTYLVTRDLLGNDDDNLRKNIRETGWCREYLNNRNPDGGWGRRFYQPKWISTHYTLLELRNLGCPGDEQMLNEINRIGIEECSADGGINPAVSIETSDTCVTAMYLNYACYYGADSNIINRIIDYLLNQRMTDGGYNCNFNQIGAVHSSLHTSVCVLEGYQSYLSSGNRYRETEIKKSINEIAAFMLEHRLYKSSRTGEIIDKKMLKFTYPYRWKYTILRALNALADAGVSYNEAMEDALRLIEKKQLADGRWKMQAEFAGQVYFTMEETGNPGRLITYLCLKALKAYR